MHITEERISEIVDLLNHHDARNRRPALLGIWTWTIRKLPEFDEDKSVDAGASADDPGVFALADGTVIHYDYTAGLWRVTGRMLADPAVPGSTVVEQTVNCEIVLTPHGFYSRCTRCPWVSENYHAKFKARTVAQEHDEDAEL